MFRVSNDRVVSIGILVFVFEKKKQVQIILLIS